jgi:hypothetical protein
MKHLIFGATTNIGSMVTEHLIAGGRTTICFREQCEEDTGVLPRPGRLARG